MSGAALRAESAADQPKVYNCPSCKAALYSPYHTVCPVCAEPVDPAKIEEALGKSVELATDEGDGHAAVLKLGLAALIGAVVIAVVLVLIR